MFIMSLSPDDHISSTSAYCTLCEDSIGNYSAAGDRFRRVAERPSGPATLTFTALT